MRACSGVYLEDVWFFGDGHMGGICFAAFFDKSRVLFFYRRFWYVGDLAWMLTLGGTGSMEVGRRVVESDFFT